LPGRHDTFEPVIITAHDDPANIHKAGKIFLCEANIFEAVLLISYYLKFNKSKFNGNPG
jgi:hypothetical protein